MLKPIYEPKGRAKEYCDLALNIYTGCNHGCKYCYAKKFYERYHPDGDFADVHPRDHILEATKKQLDTGNYAGKTIHLCFSCDPYPAGVNSAVTRAIMIAIKNAGANFSVLTKGGTDAIRDFDLYGPGDSFGSTLTFLRNLSSEAWEPRAKLPDSRVFALSLAHEKGIRTWASLEPVINVEETLDLIDWSQGAVDLYKVGMINYDPMNKEIDWKHFVERFISKMHLYSKEYYIKVDLLKVAEGEPK